MLLQRTAFVLCVLVLSSSAQAELVTYYDFNTYVDDGTTVDSTNLNGEITLTGFGAGELTSFTPGSGVNLALGSTAGTALSMGNDGSANDTGTLTVEFDTLGYGNFELSFAAMASNSAYSIATVRYSVNGTDFFDAMPPIVFDPATQGSYDQDPIVVDLSTVTQLNGLATAYLQLVFSGPNLNPGQNLVIDNLQINGTAVPEAHALAMMSVATILFGVQVYRMRRRRELGGVEASQGDLVVA